MRGKVSNSASGLLSLIENLPKDLYNRYGK